MTRKRILQVLAWPASLVVAGVFLAPLLWMVLASFRSEAAIFHHDIASWLTPRHWTLSNYPDAWRRGALGPSLLLSLSQVALIVGAGLVINSLAAYAFARLHFRGRETLFFLVVLFVILPVEAIAVPMLFSARDLGLTGGFAAALGGLTVPFMAKAFNIYFLRQHFLSVPTQIEEAAVLDGAGAWAQFRHVAWPMIRPALATVIVLDVLAHWGDFLWPLMIATREESRTLQISLANLFTQPPVQWGDILASAVLATLPIVVLFRFFQRHLVPSETGAGIK